MVFGIFSKRPGQGSVNEGESELQEKTPLEKRAEALKERTSEHREERTSEERWDREEREEREWEKRDELREWKEREENFKKIIREFLLVDPYGSPKDLMREERSLLAQIKRASRRSLSEDNLRENEYLIDRLKSRYRAFKALTQS